MKTMTIITDLCNLSYRSLLLTVISAIVLSCNSGVKSSEAKEELIDIQPISHSSFVMNYEDMTIYVDPVGGVESYADLKPANIILVTDVHGDHLNIETLQGLMESNPKIIGPTAVLDRLPEDLREKASVLVNFQSINLTLNDTEITIEGIPMYNLREEAIKFHEKGRGNGYVLTLGDERIYISGDTEDIPEMRALKDIDIAFVCMNLPWTMSVEKAAEAVLEFQPKRVIPYHYRGTNGLSDIQKFKSEVTSENPKIDVRLLNWYPNR